MGGCVAVRHHGGITPEAETLTRDTRFIFGAFSSREPVPTSLENAIRSALLRLVVRRGRTRLVLRHELVELFLVLGVTQAVEEIPEFDLLLFKTLKRLGAVFVEGAVAARLRTEAAEAEAAALHAAAHPL